MKKYPNIKYSRNSETEEKRKYFPDSKLGIFRKILISFLLIAILPLLLFGIYSYTSISKVGNSSVENVRISLDNKTREALEMQAAMVAARVRNFLNDRVADLKYLTHLKFNENEYFNFYKSKRNLIWLPDGSGKRQSGVKEYRYLYKELSFIGKKGNELFKISNGNIQLGKSLKNVSIPSNTTYLGEDYFARVKELGRDEIYVSHVNGFFVTPSEQFNDSSDIKNFKIKKYYDGVIRFAAPVYSRGVKVGYVVLAMDHMHLMEFTQHVLPNSTEKVVFPDYNSGDYAFLFDDEGWIITHPKFWDIRGFDKNGKLVPAYSRQSSYETIKKGYIPFNLDSSAFIHPNYPLVASEVRKHNTGSVVTKNVGGVLKVMAYAPIEFNEGDYAKFGVFGGVTIGSEIHRFRGSAEIVANELNDKLNLFMDDLFFFIATTFLIIIVIAWFFSKSYSDPLSGLTEVAKQYAEGNLDAGVRMNRNDEIGVLSNSFNFMAYELKKSREDLFKSLEELKTSKNQIERYAGDLEYQLKIFATIQKISNLLGSTFNFETIISEILKNCVEAIGFDRAILYLIDNDGVYLEYKESYGLTDEEKELAERSKYNLFHADCIETRVAKQGQIIFVENFENYENATELDVKIQKFSKSRSFVYVPLRVKEKIIGVMGADKLRTKSIISETDINSLQVLANQASRVLETTRLYREIIKQRNFVEDIFENMLNGIITTDENGEITSINSAAIRILELDNNALGENVYDIFPLNKELIDEINEKLNSKGDYIGYSKKVEIKSKTKYLTFNISRTDETRSTIAVIQDQTERKYLEDHVQKMDRLISLGKFAAGIAHEIRNPLTGISLFLDDIHDKLSGDKELSLLIQNSMNEISRLEKLIEEVLDFAAPGKGNRKEVEINELLDSTISFVEKQFGKNGKIIIRKLNDSSPRINCDPDKIRQSFLNIMLNAERAINSGGKLEISTSVKKLKFADMPESVKFVIVNFDDNGKGIYPEERNHLFEPFYSGFSGGTGLGLSIAQTIISEHGGRILVKESPFGGARFSIYLPIQNSD